MQVDIQKYLNKVEFHIDIFKQNKLYNFVSRKSNFDLVQIETNFWKFFANKQKKKKITGKKNNLKIFWDFQS